MCENYRPLSRNILKRAKQMDNIPYSWIQQLNIVNISVFPKFNLSHIFVLELVPALKLILKLKG